MILWAVLVKIPVYSVHVPHLENLESLSEIPGNKNPREIQASYWKTENM